MRSITVSKWDRLKADQATTVFGEAGVAMEITDQPTRFRRRIMQRVITYVLLIMAAFSVACEREKPVSENNDIDITGSGNIVSREIAVANFDRVEAGLHFNVTLHQGEAFSVTLFSDDNFIEFIEVEKTGTTLNFDLKPGYAYNFRQVALRAEVTMPELVGLSLSGSSHVTLDGFKPQGAFEAELTGSSSLSGELEADTTRFNVNGGAYVKLAGSSRILWLDACGNSVTDLSEFEAVNATLDVSCASTAVVNVDGKMDVDASQSAHVYTVDQPASGEMTANESASIQPRP